MLQRRGEVIVVKLLHHCTVEVASEAIHSNRHILLFVANIDFRVRVFDPLLNFCQTIARGDPNDHVLILVNLLRV